MGALGAAGPSSARPGTLPSSSIAWYASSAAWARSRCVPRCPRRTRTSAPRSWRCSRRSSRTGTRRDGRTSASSRCCVREPAADFPGVNVEWLGDHVLLLRESYWTAQGAHLTGFEYAPGGRFELPGDATLVDEQRPGAGWGDAASVGRFLELLATRGPPPGCPASVDRLQGETGLARAAAALLLATLPAIDDGSHNFLRADVRAVLDVKVADAKAARGSSRSRRCHMRNA